MIISIAQKLVNKPHIMEAKWFEFAFLILRLYSTCLGVVCKDGIILGTEKIVVNKMMIGGTDKRIFSINANVGCTVNGLTPDGKALMYRAREEHQQY
jgi:20S proteasome subunit alpha 7